MSETGQKQLVMEREKHMLHRHTFTYLQHMADLNHMPAGITRTFIHIVSVINKHEEGDF